MPRAFLTNNFLGEMQAIGRDSSYGTRLTPTPPSLPNTIFKRLISLTSEDVYALQGTRDFGPWTEIRRQVSQALRMMMDGYPVPTSYVVRFIAYIGDTAPAVPDYVWGLTSLELDLPDGYGHVKVHLAMHADTRQSPDTWHYAWSANFFESLAASPTRAREYVDRLAARNADGASPIDETLVFEETPDASGFLGLVRPNDETLSVLPERARRFASRTVLPNTQRGGYNPLVERMPDSTLTVHWFYRDAVDHRAGFSSEVLIREAREAYRMWLRETFRAQRGVNVEADREQRQREEHRVKSASNFQAFRNSKPASEVEVIPTLPFVPHGLASSRRWGIEIESGGARGVSAPSGWTRKGDGSLRSAWQGYREVQDFEPHDEERTETISWYECANYERHMPNEEYYDESRSEFAMRIRSDYIPVADCTDCGTVTRTVRLEPQTIVHSQQSDDCAEFVSPILVSMHSNGLETLLAAIKVQPQNDTAGVHVHVEANDLTDKQIATLVYGYDLLEPFIESSYHRNRRDYCARREANVVLAAGRTAKGRSDGSFNPRSGGRYFTVNTQALNAHGTIEFRAMGPVYEYDTLIRWAMFCREMVNSVKAGATQKDFGRIKKWADVLTLFAKFGKEYIRAAVYELSGETGSWASLDKAGALPTPEALAADISAVFEGLNNVNEGVADALRQAARALGQAGITADSIGDRLVAPDNNLVTV